MSATTAADNKVYDCDWMNKALLDRKMCAFLRYSCSKGCMASNFDTVTLFRDYAHPSLIHLGRFEIDENRAIWRHGSCR